MTFSQKKFGIFHIKLNTFLFIDIRPTPCRNGMADLSYTLTDKDKESNGIWMCDNEQQALKAINSHPKWQDSTYVVPVNYFSSDELRVVEIEINFYANEGQLKEIAE